LQIAQAKAMVLERAAWAFANHPEVVHDNAWRSQPTYPAARRHNTDGAYARHRVFSAQKVQMLRGIAGEHNMSDIPELDAHRRLEMARGHIHQGRHEHEELFVRKYGGRNPELGGLLRPAREPRPFITQNVWS